MKVILIQILFFCTVSTIIPNVSACKNGGGEQGKPLGSTPGQENAITTPNIINNPTPNSPTPNSPTPNSPTPNSPTPNLPAGQQCKVNINSDLGQPQPLYFYDNWRDFVTTNPGSTVFTLDPKQKIEVFCSSGFRKNSFTGSIDGEALTATCMGNNQFSIGSTTTLLRNLVCEDHPTHTVKTSDEKCAVGNLIEIGFNVRGKWFPLLKVCHDDKEGSTKWVLHTLKPQNSYHQGSVDRILFIQDDYYLKGLRVEGLYSKYMQRKTIGKILGSDAVAESIVLENSELYLARGHLAAKADFIFATPQLATFYYINVAPQWQSFNNGNWLQVEIGVRHIIAKRNIDATIYSGTHDVMTYPDVKGNKQQIYLALNDRTGNRIPVPKFYFKIVIAEKQSAGIVFIGVNNPYETEKNIKADYILCPDVSDKVDYIAWQPKNITAGYSYACEVGEFAKVNKHLPKLPKVKKLLL